MSTSSGRLEELILTLERQIWQLLDIRERTKRLVALEQQLAKLWMYTGGAPTPQSATFSGVLHGCNSSVQSGRTVAIKDHASGSTLASVTTDGSGNFSGSVTLSGPTQSVDVTVPAAANYAAFSTTQTWSAGTNNATGTLTLSPDSSHVCFPGCNAPVSKTLTVTDSIYGSFTMTWDGTSQWLSSGATVDYTFSGGGQSCTPATGVPVQYALAILSSTTWLAGVTWHTVGGGNTCPGPNTPTSTFNWANQGTGVTCSPFAITRTFTSPVTYYLGHAATLTITE